MASTELSGSPLQGHVVQPHRDQARHGRDHGGVWHSLFQTNSPGSEPWYPETLMVIAPGDGTFQSTSTGDVNEKKFHWTASGGIVNDEFISGSWMSNKKKKSAGTFIVNIDVSSDMIVGYLLGHGEKIAAVNYGAWVMARSSDQLESAKGVLADLSRGFKDFMFLGNDNDVSAKLRSLPTHLKLDDSQKNLLRETIRCIESEAFRAAAVCGWSLAFDILRHWMWDQPDRRRRFLNTYTREKPRNYRELVDEPSEKCVLEGLKSAGLLSGHYEKLSHYLKLRNSYAHANDRAPTIHQVNSYLDDLVDIIGDFSKTP